MEIDYELLRDFRRTLHSHPEVSGEEKETSRRIRAFLLNTNADSIESDIGGYGIVATWDSGKPGKHLLFRADMDALPIEEENDLDYISKNKGVSHSCGHDGHSTILCGLAFFISQNRPSSGKVSLLFQPAEENGEGAKAMLADPKFKPFKPDLVFALHNLPGYPQGTVVLKKGNFTAAVNSLVINLKGKTAHAAEPENGVNPALALAEILQQSIAMENNKAAREDMRVVTPVFVELGEKAYGISAGKASIHLTLRCWNDDYLRKLEKDIEDLTIAIAERHRLKVDFDYTQTFHANVNHPEAFNVLQKAVANSGLTAIERAYPFKWGEDFGLFTNEFNGCMFGIGSGENSPALHNPDYDFPDNITPDGVRVFSEIYALICRF